MKRYGQFFSASENFLFVMEKARCNQRGSRLIFTYINMKEKMRFSGIIGGREQSGWKGKGEEKNTVVIFTKREAHKKPLFGKKNNKNKW